MTDDPYRPLVAPVETLEERRARLRSIWLSTLAMQQSPEAS